VLESYALASPLLKQAVNACCAGLVVNRTGGWGGKAQLSLAGSRTTHMLSLQSSALHPLSCYNFHCSMPTDASMLNELLLAFERCVQPADQAQSSSMQCAWAVTTAYGNLCKSCMCYLAGDC
jgi:hypothetical protein